jgi:hypothetical protein
MAVKGRKREAMTTRQVRKELIVEGNDNVEGAQCRENKREN